MFSQCHWLPGLGAVVEKRTESVQHSHGYAELLTAQPVSGMCPGSVLYLLGQLHTYVPCPWSNSSNGTGVSGSVR